MATAAAWVAISSAITAGATTWQASDAHNQYEKQKKYYKEEKNKAEVEEKQQQKKNKEIQDLYKNMNTNLYSGDMSGIDTNNLIQ